MSQFRFRQLRVENYRCFETLTLPLEENLTVLFAENGGGKTALLTALAMGMAVFQRRAPRALKLDPRRDPRQITMGERGNRREPAGTCTLAWTADTSASGLVEWSSSVHPASGRSTYRHGPLLESLERIRQPGEPWPLFAWYGVERLRRGRNRTRRSEYTPDRWAAYDSALDPGLDDGPLLQWLQDELLSDVARERHGEQQRFLEKAVLEVAASATPEVDDAWYEPRERSPTVRFKSGSLASWSELSDGYHVFIALVADIARRTAMLNEVNSREALMLVEGVVLIDEIDLHLHPRWQRTVLASLCSTFPRLQFVISTHSPQVLSSAENRQARLLSAGRIQENGVYVQGRDTNAILRDHMHTGDRDDRGAQELRDLYTAIDRADRAEAEKQYRKLAEKWGETDSELIRAKGFMDWED